jgi:hypothetical protein
MLINIDTTIAMPCPCKFLMALISHPKMLKPNNIALMVHVVDATGQRTRLTDDLRLIPVRQCLFTFEFLYNM